MSESIADDPGDPGRPDVLASLGGIRGAAADERFKMVFDHAPIGQIYSDFTGRITSVNGALAAMLGYRPDEMIGRFSGEFLSSAVLEDVRRDARVLLENPASVERKLRHFQHRDGREVPVSVTSALLRDDVGQARWWVSMVIDRTDEERRAADLHLTHRAMVEAARELQLQHAVAAAANRSGSLRELAPRLLGLVSEHFDRSAVAVVSWPEPDTDDASPEITESTGDTSFLTVPARRPGGQTASWLGGSEYGTVFVPLSLPEAQTGDPSDAHPAALLLAAAVEPEPRVLELLSMVGLQAAQVVEREATARKLREGEERFRSVFDRSPLPMAVSVGRTGVFSSVNAAFCALLGKRSEQLVGLSAKDVLHPDDREFADSVGAAAISSSDGRSNTLMRYKHASGDTVYCNTTLTWIVGPDGSSQLLAQFEDLTAFRAAENALRWQADHDILTGLLNRFGITRDLMNFAEPPVRVAILFVDIDGFKLINDTRGHDAGDEVLVAVAQRLRGAVRPTDLVARFGVDEFVVVCPFSDHDQSRFAEQVADGIEEVLAVPVTTTSGPASISASVGIAEGLVDPQQPQRLIQHADAAMNRAKDLGRARRAFYDDELHQRAQERVHTESLLRTALDDGRFVLHLQPIVSLDTSQIISFESLVRLMDDSGSLVPPGEFIAVAEQSGLVVPMGTWVIQESCRIIAELRRRTARPLAISVNVAAQQAARPDLADIVLDALRDTELPASALTLELTESALLEAQDETLAQLVDLRGRGVGISLDDFGTGYSSLTYLRRLPVSGLKIDRSFVAEMMATPADRAIVRAVASLARDLGLQWVAEGVETLEQRRALRGIGSGLEQGYLFSRPVPLPDIYEMLGVAD